MYRVVIRHHLHHPRLVAEKFNNVRIIGLNLLPMANAISLFSAVGIVCLGERRETNQILLADFSVSPSRRTLGEPAVVATLAKMSNSITAGLPFRDLGKGFNEQGDCLNHNSKSNRRRIMQTFIEPKPRRAGVFPLIMRYARNIPVSKLPPIPYDPASQMSIYGGDITKMAGGDRSTCTRSSSTGERVRDFGQSDDDRKTDD